MDESFQIRIEDKIDVIGKDINEIKVTQAIQSTTLSAQHDSLSEHIRRTNLIEAQLEPIKSHVAIVNWMGKIFIALIGSYTSI